MMRSDVKFHREANGCTQKEFSKILGISISHLSLIENDKRAPSIELAFKISYEFGVPIEEIWEII